MRIYIFLVLVLFSMQSYSAPDCSNNIKLTLDTTLSAEHLCNNIDDIICRNVDRTERRGCSEKDDTIFNSQMTSTELYSFAKTCFKSSITSIEEFFTVFIPELLKGMWNTITTTSLSSAAEKSSGFIESIMSMTSDAYEAAHVDPIGYFQKQFLKLTDVIGPVIANYDCLKPELKVDKICGIAASLIIPPAILARVLVKGAVALKELKFFEKFSKASKLQQYTVGEYGKMYDKLKQLGYSPAEMDHIYDTGKLTPEFIANLKPLTTAEGLAQKNVFIDPKIIAKKTKKAEAEAKAAAVPAKEKIIKNPAKVASPTPVIKKPSSDSALDFTSNGEQYQIIKAPEMKVAKQKLVSTLYKTNYLEIQSTDIYGVTTKTPVLLESKYSDGRLVVHYFDKAKGTMEGKIVTPAELKTLKVREAPELGKEIEKLKKEAKAYDSGE